MREAADAEDATEKRAVTPGPIKPARELLGEMLLQLEAPAEALSEFEATLKKEPNRFRAITAPRKAAPPPATGPVPPRTTRHCCSSRGRRPAGRAASWPKRAKPRGNW